MSPAGAVVAAPVSGGAVVSAAGAVVAAPVSGGAVVSAAGAVVAAPECPPLPQSSSSSPQLAATSTPARSRPINLLRRRPATEIPCTRMPVPPSPKGGPPRPDGPVRRTLHRHPGSVTCPNSGQRTTERSGDLGLSSARAPRGARHGQRSAAVPATNALPKVVPVAAVDTSRCRGVNSAGIVPDAGRIPAQISICARYLLVGPLVVDDHPVMNRVGELGLHARRGGAGLTRPVGTMDDRPLLHELRLQRADVDVAELDGRSPRAPQPRRPPRPSPSTRGSRATRRAIACRPRGFVRPPGGRRDARGPGCGRGSRASGTTASSRDTARCCRRSSRRPASGRS